MTAKTSDAALVASIVDFGFAGEEEATRALNATLVTLGERLTDADRRRFSDSVPRAFRAHLEDALYFGDFGIEEFFARVSRREAVSLGRAREHAQVVCQVLGKVLPRAAVLSLEEALPIEFSGLFRRPRTRSAPDHPIVASPRHHSLATGRPGSGHPLSESRPPEGHAHSIARGADSPKATKISAQDS